MKPAKTAPKIKRSACNLHKSIMREAAVCSRMKSKVCKNWPRCVCILQGREGVDCHARI